MQPTDKKYFNTNMDYIRFYPPKANLPYLDRFWAKGMKSLLMPYSEKSGWHLKLFAFSERRGTVSKVQREHIEALAKAVEVFREKAKIVIAHERDKKSVAEKEVKQAQARLDKLTDAYLDGKVDETTYERKAAEYRRTITEKSNSPINAEFRINKAITAYQQNLEKLRSPSGLLTHFNPQTRQSFLALIFGLLSVSKDKHVTPCSNSSNNSITSALSLNLQAFDTKKDGQNPSHSSSLPLWWTNVAKGLTLENVEAAVNIMGKIVSLLESA
jgi:hypothetical protein